MVHRILRIIPLNLLILSVARLEFAGVYATETVSSPDGAITVNCNLQMDAQNPDGQMRFFFNIFFQGNQILGDSPLGLTFLDAEPLDREFRVYHLDRSKKTVSFPVLFGKTDTVRTVYQEAVFYIQEKNPPFRLLDVVFRVSDDGVAFRYRIPKQTAFREVLLTGERTAFRLTADDTLYALPLESFATPYEANYWIGPIERLKPRSLIGLPLLIRNRSAWIGLLEARLVDYAGLYLTVPVPALRVMETTLASRFDGDGVRVRCRLPMETPWRIILVSDTPGALIESNLVLVLNDPPAQDFSWVRPGKCAWPWWTDNWVEGVDFKGGMNTETLQHYLDFAAENGLEYLLIDAGWYGPADQRQRDITTPIPEVDLQSLLRRGKEKGVGIWLWLNWETVEDQMEKAFPLYKKWGVSGIKVDYMNRDDQEMNAFLIRVLEAAAREHLMVDLHGVSKPTGLCRTYPNLLTQEGVLGLEWSKGSTRCHPEHELILPFTRMLSGPMDFTPGCLRTAQQGYFNPLAKPPQAMGTLVHQLAMYVVYESPLQMCVDFPGSYRGQPGFDFIKTVPTVWDRSHVIHGKPGDAIAVARRRGSDWYVGALCDWTPRTLPIPLSFLGSGTYMASIYADSPNARFEPTNVRSYNLRVTAADVLQAVMGPGGGYAVRLSPERKGTAN